jgi:hypothetical protein
VSSSPVRATELTFDTVSPFSDYDHLAPSYGSRAASTPEGDFIYGAAGGWTPNAVVSYSSPSPTGGVERWHSGYGDLTNVIYPDNPGYPSLSITLEADPGYLVSLDHFDMAGWPTSTYVIDYVKVLDKNGVALYDQPDATILGTGSTHTRFDFSGSPLTSEKLTIVYNSARSGGWNVGIDNVQFSQVSSVPDGATLSLALVGLAPLGLLLRRRR